MPLNKSRAGSIGACDIFWTKERVSTEIRKYKFLIDLREKSNGAYLAMNRNGWYDELASHLIRTSSKRGYWNDKKRCEEESKRYEKIVEFHKNSYTAYKYSRENGWLDEFFPKK